MRRPSRQLPTLSLHCSSLREPTLKIPFILTLSLLLLTPLYNTQMVGNLSKTPEKQEKNKPQTVLETIKPNNGFSLVEDIVKTYESELNTSTLSKYQIFLNRFRRKRNAKESVARNITYLEVTYDSELNNIKDKNIQNYTNEKETNVSITLEKENKYLVEKNITESVINSDSTLINVTDQNLQNNLTVKQNDINATVDNENEYTIEITNIENIPTNSKVENVLDKSINTGNNSSLLINNRNATTINETQLEALVTAINKTNVSNNTNENHEAQQPLTNNIKGYKVTISKDPINTINKTDENSDTNENDTAQNSLSKAKDKELNKSDVLTNDTPNESLSENTYEKIMIPSRTMKYPTNHRKDNYVLITIVNTTNTKETDDDEEITKTKSTVENNKTLLHTNSNDIMNTSKYTVNSRELGVNNSMAKLKIDDATRRKIFHDYYTTVNKEFKSDLAKRENSTVIKGDDNDYDKDLKINSTLELMGTIGHKETERTYDNDSVAFHIDRSHHITADTNIFQSTRPVFTEGLPKPSSNRLVTILGLFELSVGDAPRVEGASELAAARLAINHVNQRTLLPGYKLHLITNDTKCDPGVGVDRFFHALYTERESRMVMLLGTACSEVTESIAKIVPYWNIVQVSFGSTSPALSDRSEFPLFCRTVAPDSSHNPARIAFIRQFGWDTVTAFSQNEEVYSLAVNELVTQLEAANITCTASITFAETDFKEQLQQLKKLDTRIIIGSFSQEMIPKIFCEAFKLGMFGAEYAWLVAGAPPRIRGVAPCARAQLAKALEGLVSVTAHRGIVGDVVSFSGLTNEMFYREIQSAGLSVSPFAPHTYDAVWAIALALSKAELLWRSMDNKGRTKKLGLSQFDYNRKDMAEEFLYQLGNLSFLGISGPVSFNGADRIGMSAFYQIQGGRPKTVALYTHGREMVCPECSKPQWAGGIPAARRIMVMRVESVSGPARLAVTALSAGGVALALSFLAFNLHYSKRRSIKLSSPRLNNMTLIGCVLVYTAVAMLGIDNSILPSYIPFTAMCTGRVYILSAGFSLAFGSMFAKTYRVHRIFVSNRSGVCKTKLLQDTPLISLVCALVVIDGLIVTLWTMLDPMERHLKNLTVEISTTDRSVVYQPQIEICKSQNTTGWLCALYAYKGLLLIVGVYMAWETRNVKISALNDSKYIGISVYSVVITSTSVVVIGTIISERATLAYITISSLILVATTSTLCLLFLPKIIAIRSKEEEDPVIQSMGLRLECKTRRFVTDETQELHFRIEIQNKVYKREVAALDKEIGRLEKLLAEPLETGSGSIASIVLPKRTELNTVEEEGLGRSDSDKRTPSISGGLPMLLLSVLPPVIPRASWPSAEACRGRNSVSFSSQPKLNFRKSQPSIDLYNLCLNKREENPGLLKRLKSFFGSRPTSRKASTMSIADPTGQSIAAALKLHVGMIAGLVPGTRKHSMVLSCNTLNVPNPELKLRRESYARSGPIIRITDDEPTCSKYPSDKSVSSGTQKYVAEPETRVNFVLPTTHKPVSHQSSCEKIKGSPRFPHRISPATSSLSTLDGRRKTSADSVFNVTPGVYDEQRRFSHQNVSNQEHRSKVILESRWKSTEDARPGPSTRH